VKKILFLTFPLGLTFSVFAQSKYAAIGGIETPYKNQYTFTAKLDEKTNTLSFETNAPVTVVTLETYTEDEIITRKGVEYTNTYFKTGNKYSYDLKKPLLKDKQAYWLKVSIGNNGVPLAEYYFKKRTVAPEPVEEAANENNEEVKDASGATVIRTNATCAAGKTKLITSLKALDGVRDVKIDPKGTINIKYSSDGTPYSGLLATINENGFNANNLKTSNASANPCGKIDGIGKIDKIEKLDPQKFDLKPNLLDATPGYRKAAIKFVPLQADASKGYSDNKVYNWVDSLGNQHSATGKEILDEVNQLEKALNTRGHSLRDKKPFDGLTFPLKLVAKNDLTNCVITNNLVKTSGPKYQINSFSNPKKYTVVKNLVASTIYAYFGEVVTNAAEFKIGWLNSSILFTRTGNDASAKMGLVFQPAMYAKVNKCVVDVSENAGGTTLFSTTIDIKKPDATFQPYNYSMSFGEAVEPQYMSKDYTMRTYNLLFSNEGNILPPATRYAKPYFVTLKFYDAAGNLLTTNQPNQLILNNQLPMPLNIPVSGGKQYAGYNYEFLDPGLHCFGFFSRSTGFSADYYSMDSGYDGKRKISSVKANMEIGVKYYNWQRLIDNNAPITKDFVLFGYDINSEEKFYKGDGLPGIRIPGGFKKEDPDQGIVTLLGTSYNLNTTDKNNFSEKISETIANVDFFIGPVPCNITVSVSGTVNINADYQRGNNSDIKTTLTPHADITMHGSGGVDAKIMYAKVFADINLLSIDMAYALEVNNEDKNRNVKIDPQLKVGGLSGQVYFQAGFCIPIPLVDDICESFRIDILNWKGFEKSFKIDPKKGISL